MLNNLFVCDNSAGFLVLLPLFATADSWPPAKFHRYIQFIHKFIIIIINMQTLPLFMVFVLRVSSPLSFQEVRSWKERASSWLGWKRKWICDAGMRGISDRESRGGSGAPNANSINNNGVIVWVVESWEESGVKLCRGSVSSTFRLPLSGGGAPWKSGSRNSRQ